MFQKARLFWFEIIFKTLISNEDLLSKTFYVSKEHIAKMIIFARSLIWIYFQYNIAKCK